MHASIFNHLFLPCYLPSAAEDDFLIRNNGHNEYKLLESINGFFHSLDQTKRLPIFSVLSNCIQRWSILQNLSNISVSHLQSTLRQLQPGDFLPIYFHAQNAAILIEIDEDPRKEPLISSWQVLLPTRDITSSLTPHFSCFPAPKFRLSNHIELSKNVHCELLIEFLTNTIEYSKAQKSSCTFDETRDVPESHYVCQWWIQQMQGLKIESDTNKLVQFKKKHRDQIRWKRSATPFRRSGLWMTIKVILQTILTQRLGTLGNLIYKLLITLFLTYYMYSMRTSNIESDHLVHGIRKIARRLNKIDTNLSSFVNRSEIKGWIKQVKEEIQLTIRKMIPKLNWQDSFRIESRRISFKNFDHDQLYHHSCSKLNTYLNEKTSNPSSEILNQFDFTFIDIHPVDSIPSMIDLINRSNYTIDMALTRQELWIELSLKQWINGSFKSNKKPFEFLLNFYEEYQNTALPHYSQDHPMGYSRFLLTSLTLLSIMHKKLIQDERFNRLKSHSIDIPNLVEMFDLLILPHRKEMIRAHDLYKYFRKFANKSFPDLLSKISSSEAFGIFIAGQSTTMLKCLDEIKAEAERDRKAKIQEVNEAKRKYTELIATVNNLQCECVSSPVPSTCLRCSTLDQANDIRVQIYECPIPSNRDLALAVVFELQMPHELRCYREILWQFVNRCDPQPNNNQMFEWSKVSPHSTKLARFNTCPKTCKVKLVSSEKSITQSHYNTPPCVASTLVESFLYENSLKVQISPTKPISFEAEYARFSPRIDHPDYKYLEFTIGSTQFEQNRVIANLSHCSERLAPTQFVEFGSFRSGHCLQWWNLLIIFEMDSLPIHEESVVILIMHAILQSGPDELDKQSSDYSWCRKSHQQILEDHLVDEFISRLNRRLDDCELNWHSELVLVVIIMITMRIFTICNETRIDRVKELIFTCRRIGEKWIDLISESIQSLSTSDLNEINKLREKMVTIASSCLFTFSTHPERMHDILWSDVHMISFLRAATTRHDNIILNKNQTDLSYLMKTLLHWSEHILVTIQPSIAALLERELYRSLNLFSVIYWATIRNISQIDGQWKKRRKDLYDGWYDGQFKSMNISIDCLKGTFLVNGMTVGFLPEKITSDALFLRVFDHHIFEVQPAASNHTYITKHPYHNGKVHYEFHYNDRMNRLIIAERYLHNKDIFELIPSDIFEGEFPDTFVLNQSHWMNRRNQQIEFRPVQFDDKKFLINKPYLFTWNTGSVTTTDKQYTQTLVNRSSLLFQDLFKHYFYRLDDEPYVYMMSNSTYENPRHKRQRIDPIIHIHLSRLGITFEYNTSEKRITSREYSNMYIDEDQWLGTLTGLQSGLLLSSLSINHQQDRYDRCRKLIVPFGKLHAQRESSTDDHQTVFMERKSDMIFSHQYFVFNFNDRLSILQSTDSPTGWLYLALLHAMTSHSLPDEYTGMTGMERAFQLLNSAGCWSDQPFDALSMNILVQIAMISPRVNYYPKHLTCMIQIDWHSQSLPCSLQHFGYYLLVKQLIEWSQQLHFMHPSVGSDDEAKLLDNSKYNVEVLTKLYWDYRDSYNPTARLSVDMEAEILKKHSTKEYRPTTFCFPSARIYSQISLLNGLYQCGEVNLKDITPLNIFPLSRWLNKDYVLKNVWIGLLKLANSIKETESRSRQNDIERFELLIDFLHYISSAYQIQPFYLQMLKTMLTNSKISLSSVGTFPEFIAYTNIEQISVQRERISFPRRMKDDKRKEIVSKIEECFGKNLTYHNSNDLQINQINPSQINTFLNSWRSNKKLRSFFVIVQNLLSNVPPVPLRSRISIDSQQFALELMRNHHRIKLISANVPINQELLRHAHRRFCRSSDQNLLPLKRSTRLLRDLRAFPHGIFPSMNKETNPLKSIADYFQQQIEKSWKDLQTTESYCSMDRSTDKIQDLLDSLHSESKRFWTDLLISIRGRNELLFKTGVMSRITPSTLISCFLQIWLNDKQRDNDSRIVVPFHLTSEQQMLLGGTIVNWIVEQHLQRVLICARQNNWEDFDKELTNMPHSNWIPSEHLPWLILELEMNMTIRKIQVDVARHMIEPTIMSDETRTRNTVMQMNMGEGKTSVIIPMLALSLCSRSLVRLVVLKSLFVMNYQALRFKLGGLLNRRVFPFACRRDMNFNHSQIQQMFNRFRQGFDNYDIVITSPEDILSFDLLTIDKCRRQEFDTSRSMLTMQRWLKKFARDILDESDEILHVKYQLIYTIGGQQKVDGGIERWKTIQLVLNLVKQSAEKIVKSYKNDVCYKSPQCKSAFPHFRLLSHRSYQSLCKTIAKNWIKQKNYRSIDESLILSFILEINTSIDCVNGRFSPSTIQLFLILRGLLSSEVLFVALKKRYRVNFGVNSSPTFNRLMAVPFRAKDVAAEKTEFGHPDVALVLTQLSYYYSGLQDEHLLQCFHRLIYEEKDPESIYEEWILQEDIHQLHSSIQQWKGVNIKDIRQRTKYLFPALKYNMLVINYFLNCFVFPREAKQFPYKLISSAWDLSSSIRTHIITGFSGTNDTQLLLPTHICQRDLPELQTTNAIVLHYLLQTENANYQTLPINAVSNEILNKIVDNELMINVILDVGALFIDGTTRDIAVNWLNLSDGNKIDYAVYLESDSIVVCDRQYRHHAFLTSPASERLDRCVIYLDEIHTRGTDFKFPIGFRAAVTLGNGLTKDRLVQACMRMRKLGKGHSLVFWSSHEVDQQIGISKGKEKSGINQIDILRWVYENTQRATWDGLHHWATQSLNYQRKLAAFQQVCWTDDQQLFSDKLMEELARDSSEAEIIDLKQMYGASRVPQTLLEIYSTRYRMCNFSLTKELHHAVLERLRSFPGTKTRLAQLLDEEQERELEQELEEERQLTRPPSVSPCKPVLHPEIQRLCNADEKMMDLTQYPLVFRPLADAFAGTTFVQDCQPDSWQGHFWISTEFQRVITTKGELLNPFLRPPRWLVVYRNQHLIFVSPFEANWLLDQLHALVRKKTFSNPSDTTLRLLLPRTKRTQSVFINTPTLTISPSISSTFFLIPIDGLAQLFVFNGTLFFENANEQTAYCQCLALCPKPYTENEKAAFEQGWIADDGFVSRLKHRHHLQISNARFASNPLMFVKQLIENRNNSHAPLTSHVGSIIFDARKLLPL